MSSRKKLVSLFTRIRKILQISKVNSYGFRCYVKNCFPGIYKLRTANFRQPLYRGADKSLARSERKRATFPAFYGIREVHYRINNSPPVPTLTKSILLLITLLIGAACFLPGWAKDLSAPSYCFVLKEEHILFLVSYLSVNERKTTTKFNSKISLGLSVLYVPYTQLVS